MRNKGGSYRLATRMVRPLIFEDYLPIPPPSRCLGYGVDFFPGKHKNLRVLKNIELTGRISDE